MPQREAVCFIFNLLTWNMIKWSKKNGKRFVLKEIERKEGTEWKIATMQMSVRKRIFHSVYLLDTNYVI